ncbi:pirin family protein [Nocardioides marmoriginsengisoli]|uniref:Pirin family protein n=1 Tax=Nocardioides marmoriginsengisoli TaxID=661483 RepID=A0A3N0CB19_9ACTN|nr:pirin family protein [Nocardioides marmoriginsengisoli]RNL60650.1 pirin family protein [Nocardioides marmoriginsengisoli]
MSIEVRRGDERFVTRAEGRTTRHSFSFGSHYDPANLGFAAMTALNDEELPDGTGYPDHAHADTEIVTWVLDGALRHTDAAGNTGLLLPGDVQRISAGAGIVHAEVTEPGVRTRFLQTWLRPDESGGAASYAVSRGGTGSDLTEVVGPGGLGLGVAGARLYVATAAAGEIRLPDAPLLHVFVADGQVEVGAVRLTAGDARRGEHGAGVLDANDAARRQDERPGTTLRAGDAARLADHGESTLRVLEAGPVAVWAFGT